MFPLLFFPFACGSPLSFSSLVCGVFHLLSFALFAFFFLLALLLHCFFRLAFFGSFPLFPLCVCVLLFLVCFDNPPIPPVLLLFFPVVVLFCCPIKTARNGPIKNPDNGRNSANQRSANRANQRAFFSPPPPMGGMVLVRQLEKHRAAGIPKKKDRAPVLVALYQDRQYPK